MPHTVTNLIAAQSRPRAITITDVAEQIGEMHHLYFDMDEAQGPAEAARNALAQKNDLGDAYTDACQAATRIDRIGALAYERSKALQELLYKMEPRTLSETLSLAILVLDRLDDLKSGASEGSDEELKALKRAMLAVIRGLFGAGATSPLLDAFTTEADLTPWEDERTLAEADAKRLIEEARQC